MRLQTRVENLHWPVSETVDLYIGRMPDPYYADKRPSDKPEEWKKDHRAFILNWYLPVLRPPDKIWRICAEAYIAGMEPLCDGSTAVPNCLYRNGNIKDPQGVTHDYLFQLHHHGRSDAYGHVWTLDEANRMYRDFCLEDGWHVRGWVRYAGLCLVSIIPWTWGKAA
jgi:hypothetical protein